MNLEAGATSPNTWVPVTKLVPPPVGPEVVVDLDRLDWLGDVVIRHRLTTLVAQGGSGKSTLVAATVEQLDVPVAWIRWHSGDDHPRKIIETIALALQRVNENRAGATNILNSSGPPLNPDQLVGLLVNDLATIGPVVIVLDDFHMLKSEASRAVLASLIDLAPPHTHLVATARTMPELPLARLHAAGQWARLDGEDLRVDAAAAPELLDHHRIELPLERAVALADEMNGWMVGFLLAARAEASGRPIGAGHQDMAAYLTEEVLADEEVDVVTFMSQTSILDVLDADVCNAVTGRSDAASVLSHLRTRLGFLVIDHGPAFHYHDLLRDHLRRELTQTSDRDQIVALHRRAAAATTGDVRIEHLLAAGDHAEAADIIEARSRSWTRHPTTDHQTAEWTSRLPQAVRDDHPWLEVVSVTTSYLGRPSEDDVLRLIATIEHADAADVELRWLAARTLLVATMDVDRWAPEVDRSADPRLEHLDLVRSESLTALAWTDHWSGKRDRAFSRASEAIDIARSTRDSTVVEGLAIHLSAPLACAPGAVDRLSDYHGWAHDAFGSRSRLVDVSCRVEPTWNFSKCSEPAHATRRSSARSISTSSRTLHCCR